ncbi:hypothetical protein F2Q70_00033640 [Brassica cretica]|uniref:Uncharacterized protein n=1 Tax=Brassica cretica TaxID=69181 RepID=A0A8S9FPV1_BRACR|nr:hypothetical protein F2Q70_00033640 [Brassica cretica]
MNPIPTLCFSLPGLLPLFFCLRAGALMAVLSFLDFFSTVSSIVLEYASICLTRIAEAFALYPVKLDELCNHGLGLILLLSTCASGSPLGSRTLLILGISSILKDILLGSAVSAYASVSPALSRPADQIFEIVNLANELLPPLPQGVISLPTAGTNTLVKGSGQKKPSLSTSGKREDSLKVSPRQKLLSHQPELLQQFGLDLLPVLVQPRPKNPVNDALIPNS